MQKKYDDAINLADEIIHETENYISAYILGAKASYLKGDYERTKEYAQDALSLDINCSAGYYYLALSRQSTNDSEEAIECMKRAILYDLNNPEYYAKMSEIYEAKQDYKTAFEYIKEAESIDSKTEYRISYKRLASLSRKNLTSQKI